MAQYRKRPVVVEAVRWNGPEDNDSLAAFCGHWVSIGPVVIVTTLEGHMRVSPGDYVIRGIKGEFYPCKAEIFEATYDLV